MNQRRMENARGKIIRYSVLVQAPAREVWQYLTSAERVKRWMSDETTALDVFSSFEKGTPFIIRGDLHGIKFENTGTVVESEQEKVVAFTHLSSISGLAGNPGDFSLLRFELKPVSGGRLLTLSIRNFPTDSIYHHLSFYWRITLEKLKQDAEEEFQRANAATDFH